MNAVARIESQDQLPVSQESAIDRIIAAALNQDIDIDRIKELYALKLQHEANEARKQFKVQVSEAHVTGLKQDGQVDLTASLQPATIK